MASRSNESTVTTFEDLFPSMVGRLGTEGFMEELSNGFKLLMDPQKNLITFESLKNNSSRLLGLDFYQNTKGVFGSENNGDGDGDEMIREMLREGDLDGDGCLNLMEFCVLMLRLSPSLMDASKMWLHQQFTSSSTN